VKLAIVLSAFCLHWPSALPGQLTHAARAAHVPVALFAANIGAESTCDNRRVSRLGAIGYGQILPGGSAAQGHTRRQLRRSRLNLRLAAEHLHRGLRLCHGNAREAVAFYSGVWPCQETAWSRRVVSAVERARRS